MKNAIFDVEEYEREYGEIETVYPSPARIPEEIEKEIITYKPSKFRRIAGLVSAVIACTLFQMGTYVAEFYLATIPFVIFPMLIIRKETDKLL